MSNDIRTLYPGRVNPADANYPFGSIKNESVPGSNDGTPLTAEWGNDFEALKQGALKEAGETPSSITDTAINSQILGAIKNNTATVADIATGRYPVGRRLTVTDRADATFNVVAGGTPNGYDIIDAGNGNTAVLQSNGKSVSFAAFGAIPNSIDCYQNWLAMVDFVANNGIWGVVDGNEDYLFSDHARINRSGVHICWSGNAFLKLTESSTTGSVLVITPDNVAVDPLVDGVTLYEPKVDGGNLGWKNGALYGENGVAGTKCINVRVIGGEARNCVYGTSSQTSSGGKGIQFENGVGGILVDGFTSRNCSIGFETGGTIDSGAVPPASNLSSSTMVLYTNLKAYNCGRVVSFQHQNSPPDITVSTNAIVVDGVQAFNCGREEEAGHTNDFGILYNDRCNNVTVKNMSVYNEVSYGSVGSVVRQIRGENNNYEIELIGDCDYPVNHTASPTSGTSGDLKNNYTSVRVKGSCLVGLYAGAAIPALSESRYYIWADVFLTRLQENTITSATCAVHYRSGTANVIGKASNIIALSQNNLANGIQEFYDSMQIFDLRMSKGGGGNTLGTVVDSDLVMSRNGSNRISLTTRGYASLNLPVYANNNDALAGGLLVNDEYKTSTGERRIVV